MFAWLKRLIFGEPLDTEHELQLLVQSLSENSYSLPNMQGAKLELDPWVIKEIE